MPFEHLERMPTGRMLACSLDERPRLLRNRVLGLR